MLTGFIILLVLTVIFLPQFWVRAVMKKYNVPIDEMPGTGAELVQHLKEKFQINKLDIEIAEPGNDHYSPQEKTIRLSEDNFHGKSLTAVTIAAHEFGHALQDHYSYQPLKWRTSMAHFSAIAQKVASLILVLVPFSVVLVKVPIFNFMFLISGLSIMLLPVLLHLMTLPVEFDASFNRALPILEQGKYLPESALPVAKKILTAAAMTYVAASLASLLNFYRWFAILKR